MGENKILVLWVLCILLWFIIAPNSLYAEASQDNSTRQDEKNDYKIKFFSLKRGSTIGPSQFQLLDNGVFEFDIEKEELIDPKGTYRIKNAIFEATAEFSVKKRRRYQYILYFKGIKVFNSYVVGTVRLREHIDGNKLTQEVSFFFFGSQKLENEKKGDNLFPW